MNEIYHICKAAYQNRDFIRQTIALRYRVIGSSSVQFMGEFLSYRNTNDPSAASQLPFIPYS